MIRLHPQLAARLMHVFMQQFRAVFLSHDFSIDFRSVLIRLFLIVYIFLIYI
jgi:hypothetical protein